MQQVNPKLIVNVGASNGNDIQYCLRKGFDVVGLEAYPVTCASLRRRRPAASWSSSGATNATRGCRRSTSKVQFREHVVPCSGRTVDWPEIVALRGVPLPRLSR
jgi:hypothetical protein